MVKADETRKVGSFTAYRILLAKDVREEFRTREMIVSMAIYSLLVIIVFGVALSFAPRGMIGAEVTGGLLWALIVFTSLLGLNRSFGRERENDCIEGLLLAPIDRGSLFLAKATSNLLFLLIVEVIAVPLYAFFVAPDIVLGETAPWTLLVLLLGSIGIAAVGTLLATITASTRGRDVLLAVLFVPVIFPLLDACVSATVASLVGGDVFSETFATSMLLAGAFDVIMILAAWALYDFVVSA